MYFSGQGGTCTKEGLGFGQNKKGTKFGAERGKDFDGQIKAQKLEHTSNTDALNQQNSSKINSLHFITTTQTNDCVDNTGELQKNCEKPQ